MANTKRQFHALLAMLAIILGVLSVALPAQATELPDQHGALKCKVYQLSPVQKVEACVDVTTFGDEMGGVYISGVADVTAYKKVVLEGVKTWVEDDSVLVSVDVVNVYADGHQAAAPAYPSGPMPGHAFGATRQTSAEDGSVSHLAFAKATLGIWNSEGVEVNTINVRTNNVLIPPQV